MERSHGLTLKRKNASAAGERSRATRPMPTRMTTTPIAFEAVMGEYIARIHEVKGRPLYVVSEAHGLLGPRTARAIEVPASTPEVP